MLHSGSMRGPSHLHNGMVVAIAQRRLCHCFAPFAEAQEEGADTRSVIEYPGLGAAMGVLP